MATKNNAQKLLCTAEVFEQFRSRKSRFWSAKDCGQHTGRVGNKTMEKWIAEGLVEIHQGVDYDYAYPTRCRECLQSGYPLNYEGCCEECEEVCELCLDRKRHDEMATKHICRECAE